MRKVLLPSFLALGMISITAPSTHAFGDGFYAGGAAGYAYNTAQTKESIANQLSQFTNTSGTKVSVPLNHLKAKNHSFNGALFMGYEKMIKPSWVLDLRLFGTYDTAKMRLLEIDVTKTIGGIAITSTDFKLHYKPNMGLGIGAYIGHICWDDYLLYGGLGGELNFSKLEISESTINLANNTKHSFNKYTTSQQNFALIPTVGIKGKINEKTRWSFEMGYKFMMYERWGSRSWNLISKKKPGAFIARVGVSYHPEG